VRAGEGPVVCRFATEAAMGAQTPAVRVSKLERLFEALLPFLVRWTKGRLPSYARRRMDTGDVVQEAIVAALRRSGQLDRLDPEDLRRYLQAAILNKIRDEIRRAGLGETTNGTPHAARDRGPTPLEEAIDSEERVRYRTALLRLSDGDRELLVGRVDLGLGYEELALATGRPTAEAARAATRRALGKLVAGLGDEAPPELGERP